MSFEQVREQMNSDISKSEASSPSTQTDNQSHQQASSGDTRESSSNQQQSTGDKAQAVIDLEKLERFIYGGKEWTPKDLKNAVLMQSDYTKKTQEIAKEREFHDNLRFDLQKVWSDPSLSQEFKQIYPEKFHAYLELLESVRNQPGSQTTQQATQQQTQRFEIPDEVKSRLSKVDQLETYIRNQEAQVIETKLDALGDKMATKYPFADEVQVLATAEALHNKGVKLDDAAWENIWERTHNRAKQIFDKHQKQLINSQTEASKKAKDVASGGGIPGQAPNMPKSFKEAREMAINDLSRTR